ncbi:MAG: flagellar hook-associated family protein [Rhizobiaceae bacterium]|nr:flagellar hook-associated family protein [Rhizobiaceae bacterium]
MKTSFVSTSSVSQALRYQLMRMQSQLVGANKEMQNGVVADRGLALGARTTQSISLNRDMERVNGIIDQNGLVASRLTATQNALKQIEEKAQTLLSTLTAGINGEATQAVTLVDAKGTLSSLTSIANTTLNGEHIFAGINTDVKPLDDYTAAGSPAKAAFDASFQSFFGFTQSDPAAANITAAQMTSFIDTVVVPDFMGAGWDANWSQASDQTITSRIALNETLNTSVNAKDDSFRKLAMAATAVYEMLSSPTMSTAAKTAVTERAHSMVGEAIADLATLQSEIGVIQQRVSKATERLQTQSDLLERTIGKMEAVDPYEAQTKVSMLMEQIELSYALTARLQKLSLSKFL